MQKTNKQCVPIKFPGRNANANAMNAQTNQWCKRCDAQEPKNKDAERAMQERAENAERWKGKTGKRGFEGF